MTSGAQHPIPQRWVQSCITNVSFPTTLDGVRSLVGKNCDDANALTDLDVLLSPRLTHELFWTAPRWMTTGDVLFFYHAVSATTRIRRLLKQAQSSSNTPLIKVLQHAEQLAAMYAGTIFACAAVAGSSERIEHDDVLSHFKSTMYAPLKRVHIFEAPVSAEQFQQFVRINRQGTITLLGRNEFNGLKHLLSQRNPLPLFLEAAQFGEQHFRAINKDNWFTIACAPQTRFIHEAQVRSYFLDYLLSELKDKGSPLLQECHCFRRGHATGFADYFVQIHNVWVPIEAKLSVLLERDIPAQVQRYIHVDTMKPTKGTNRNRTFVVADSSLCIVADQDGIYVTKNGKFVDSAPGSPKWKREQLNQAVVRDIREHIAALAV
jgi:hypothetical protein